MNESPVPSTYRARIVTSDFDTAQSRHIAHLRISADGDVTMVMVCHADLPQAAPEQVLHSALIADATRQLSRLPEHRRRAVPQVVYDPSTQG